MHVVDIVAVTVAIVLVMVCAAVLARQRYMLRVVGAVPLALRLSANRWLYGIARYSGDELRWYRSLGLGTRPNRVFLRSELHIRANRPPSAAERSSLPASAVVVDCTASGSALTVALGRDAFTGFISWLESSAPAD